MKELIVKEIINSDRATDNKQGDMVYKEIKDNLDLNKEVICVDFQELRLITTAFLNNAIGRIYVEYEREKIKERILVRNISSKSDLKLLQLVILNAIGIK